MKNDSFQSTSEAMANRAAVDPLLLVVNAYIAERDRYNAAPDPANETEEFLDFVLLGELTRILTEETPVCGSDAGAKAAMALVTENLNHSIGGFQTPVLKSVVAYIECRGRERADCSLAAIEVHTLH